MFAILEGAAVKSAVVLALAWGITKMMRRASAAARHLVWTASAAVVIAMPIVSAWTPAWIPVWRVADPVAMFQVNSSGAEPEAAIAPASGTTRGPLRGRASGIPDWRTVIVCVWAIGTIAAVLQMLFGFAAIARMRKRLARRGVVEGVEVIEARAGSMPMAAGIWKPAVFVPADANEWPEERRRAVMLHEMAHVHRGDAATQLLARVALAMYWWNPLAWTAWRESMKERERAADDAVLTAGVGASEYASHLLDVARRMSAFTWTAGVAMARSSQLEGRVLAILDSKTSRKSPGRWSALAAGGCAVVVLGSLGVVRAQDSTAIPADTDAAIRIAQGQRDPALLDKIAILAEDRGLFGEARQALEAGLEIRGQVWGTTSAEYGVGVLKLADLELREHGLRASGARYQQAADLLTDRPEGAAALMKLGEIAMADKNLDSAASYFSKAQASDPKNAGLATMWLADTRAKQGNTNEADALYKSALAMEAPDSLGKAMVTAGYAGFLYRQGLDEESKVYSDQATQIYKAVGGRARTPQTGVSMAYKIGDGVSAPRVLAKTKPGYSEEARLAKWQGTVVLSVVVGADGLAHDISVTRSLGMGLDDKAVAAVSQWRFSPGMKDGVPVPVIATIEVNFHLL
jgi:TonB family protein